MARPLQDEFQAPLSHPECSTEVVNLVNRLQGGWNRICICAGRYLSIGRYPIAGSYVTHRSTPICVLVLRLLGCKYHRRVSLLSSQISHSTRVYALPHVQARGGASALPWARTTAPAGRAFYKFLGGFLQEVRYFKIVVVWVAEDVEFFCWAFYSHFVVDVLDVGFDGCEVIVHDVVAGEKCHYLFGESACDDDEPDGDCGEGDEESEDCGHGCCWDKHLRWCFLVI